MDLYDSLQRKINIHETNILNRQKAITHNELIKTKEQEDNLLLSELKVELDDLYSSIQVLKSSKNILDKDLSPFLLESGVVDIVNIMNHIFTKIHPDYEISIKQEKKNLEFFYNYLDTKGERISHPVLMASGFERQIISLSFKLALTILSGSRILFLDETDSDASEENSIIFYDRLLETNVLDQVFIVSHKPETVNHLINNFGARCFYLENGKVIKVEN
jgi:DNA repair exonuclease SbcCD ATPase subunit